MENIPGKIPFVKPIGPGVVITIDTTNAVIATEKVKWEDNVRLYNDINSYKVR